VVEIFINYRTDDEPYAAPLLDSNLAQHFGPDVVFRDSRSIMPGDDFEPRIFDAVRGATVLLVVIGPKWLTAAGPDGRRRLDDPNDFVRREIATAFAHGVRVVPVLMNADRIRAADLPADIAALAASQDVRVDVRDSHADLSRLVDQLRQLIGSRRRGRRRLIVAASAVAVAAVLAGALIAIYHPKTETGPPVGIVVQNAADPTAGGVVYALPGTLSPQPSSMAVGPQLAGVVGKDGAAQLGAVNLSLVLIGRRDRPVVITEIRGVVLKHDQPLHGTLLYAPAQGVTSAVNGCVYLGSAMPVLQRVTPTTGACDPSGTRYFAANTLMLANGEQSVVNLAVKAASSGYYEFELVMTAAVDGKSTEIVVKNGTKPFQLTTYASSYATVYAATGDDEDLLNSVPPGDFCQPSCGGRR
jgi:TIR domain-containing protein